MFTCRYHQNPRYLASAASAAAADVAGGVCLSSTLTEKCYKHHKIIDMQIRDVKTILRYVYFFTKTRLTPSTPAVLNCCCSKSSAPYWSNPPFLISDIRALWRSVLSARAPECQILKMVG